MIGAGELTFIPYPSQLAYGMSQLEAAGLDAVIIDAIGEGLSEDAYYRRVEDAAPDLVINDLSTPSYVTDLAIAAVLKSRTGAKIAFCGTHPTALPREVLEESVADLVFLQEIDASIVDVVTALRDGRSLHDVPGIAFRTHDGQIVVNRTREPVRDLDALPHPHRASLPLDRYRVAGYASPVLFMYSSRSCPYRCTFCLWPQTVAAAGYRVRSPRVVVDEIEDAHRRFGPFRSIYFDDDTFNIGRKRMLAFADEFARRSWRLPWGCNARSEHCDQEVLDRLAAVGLFNLRIGVESADPEVLRRSKKDLDLDSVPRAIDMAHRAGIKVHISFTFGLAGESETSIDRTVAFARSLRCDSMAFTITTPFPGTEYFREVETRGYLATRDWTRYDCSGQAIIRTDALSAEELTVAAKRAMRRLYISPRYIARRLRYVSSSGELLSLCKKGARLFGGRMSYDRPPDSSVAPTVTRAT